jgi:hypothetical protein
MKSDAHHRSYCIASMLVAIVSFVLAVPRPLPPIRELSGKVDRVTPYMGRVLAVELDSGSVIKFSHVGRRHPLRSLQPNEDVVLSAYSKAPDDIWGTSLRRKQVVLYSSRFHSRCRAVHRIGWFAIGIFASVFGGLCLLRYKRERRGHSESAD